MICIHQGNGEIINGLIPCNSNRLIHRIQGKVNPDFCKVCPYVNRENIVEVTCKYLLPVIRTAICTTCSQKGMEAEVHGCKIHGECVFHNYGAKKTDGSKIVACATCEQFEAELS